MNGMTAFACISDIDLDLIEESMTLFASEQPLPCGASAVRGRRASSAIGRFFSSGWGVAAICAIVSVSVLAAIVWAGNRPVLPPTPSVSESTESIAETESASVTEPESVTLPGTDWGEETSALPDTTAEPETEGVLYPDITEGGILFISNGDGTCKVKGADKAQEGKLTVPETSPYGDTVTTVATGGFKGFSKLTSVSLPDTVTVIKTSAFEGCGSLKSVDLPPVVTEFGRNMFNGCGELQRVVLPAGVTEIGMCTFQTCVSLQSVVAQEGITAIGANAFNGCASLSELTLPAGLQSIGASAFLNCCGLRTVYYGGSRAEWSRVEVHSTGNGYIHRVTVVFTGE